MLLPAGAGGAMMQLHYFGGAKGSFSISRRMRSRCALTPYPTVVRLVLA